MSNKAYQDAIKSIESLGSGGYSARGPVITSGMYEGERAMGAYQVMPKNLPQWSRLALGKEITESEFMGSQEYQDAIFNDQFSRNVEKYGNVNDAVSTWFTGGPLSTHGENSDGYINANAYVGKFNNFIGNSVPQMGTPQVPQSSPPAQTPPTAPAVDEMPANQALTEDPVTDVLTTLIKSAIEVPQQRPIPPPVRRRQPFQPISLTSRRN